MRGAGGSERDEKISSLMASSNFEMIPILVLCFITIELLGSYLATVPLCVCSSKTAGVHQKSKDCIYIVYQRLLLPWYAFPGVSNKDFAYIDEWPF